MDESDCSFRALDYGLDLARQTNHTIEVVHYTEKPTERTVSFRDRVSERLSNAGFAEGTVEVVTEVRLGHPRSSSVVGKRILQWVDDTDSDIEHIVMGHHGTGRVGRALLGSAAETVVRGTTVPVTVIP